MESNLYLDRVLYPVTALGPGNRLALWVSGCRRHCFHCANPELWERRPEQRVRVERLLPALNQLLREKCPDGITITGGEPFDQARALCDLLDGMEALPGDILIYTGYQLEELSERKEESRLLERVSVLIDGPYREEENQRSVVLRGSGNQRIWYFDPGQKERYQTYLQQGRQIQNFVYDYRILSVGIHTPCRTGKDRNGPAEERKGREA